MPKRSPRVLLLIGLLVTACIPSNVSTPSPPGSAAASASSQPEPSTASPEPSVEPASEEPPASVAPAETASPPAAEASAPASSGLGPATACSGTDRNREFFEAAAAAVTWTVYCAVLPTGWFVESGRYRGSGGGWVEIAYKGPGGARLELQEGAFCADADGCVPPGTDSGEASFGNRPGTLVALDGGGWAVVVDRGKTLSWLAVGMGINEATFRRLAGALAIVVG
jgi:hypothetical protein